MNFSKNTLAWDDASGSSYVDIEDVPYASSTNTVATPSTSTTSGFSEQVGKRKRSLPGTPDPDAEVIALSPERLMATNRFVCEICERGFQRDQNLQLHRRGHNLPWKLKQKTSTDTPKRVYVCPEATCVHHDPSRALGDLTGIKKHFCRKHGEKRFNCERCNKRYAVLSDWKAHSKHCGTGEHRCDCGMMFSRYGKFIEHRALCGPLAKENTRVSATRPGQTAIGYPSLGANPSAGGVSFVGASSSPRSPRNAYVSARGGEMDFMAVSAAPWSGVGGNLHTMRLDDGGLNLRGMWPANFIDSGSQVVMQPPGMQQSGSGTPHVMGGLSEFDIPQTFVSSAGLKQMPRAPDNIFANHLGSGNGLPRMQGSSGSGQGGGNLRMSEMVSPGFVDVQSRTPNRFEGDGAGAQRLPLSSAAGMSWSPSSANNSAMSTATLPPISNQQQNISSTQMSATSLLQKAAQMGVSTSKTSFLRAYGMGGGSGGGGQRSHEAVEIENSSSGATSWEAEGPPNRQDQGRTASLPPISNMSGLHI